jgi:carbon-monoxide dehydrogenase medium subunit
LGADGSIEQAFVAFNGLGDHATRAYGVETALQGQTLSAETIAAASAAATEGVEIIMSDHYADEAYRSHLAQVICRRALGGL